MNICIHCNQDRPVDKYCVQVLSSDGTKRCVQQTKSNASFVYKKPSDSTNNPPILNDQWKIE